MKNTNKTGGTRYSEGKPELLWTPALGFVELFEVFDEMAPELGQYPLMEMLAGSAFGLSSAGASKESVAAIAIVLSLLLTMEDDDDVEVNKWYLLRAWPYVGRVSMYGTGKYAPHDWHVGQDYSVLINSMLRHVQHVLVDGHEVKDEESGLPSAAHALWNCLAYLTFVVEGRSDLDDITPYIGETTAQVQGEETTQTDAENSRNPVILFPGGGGIQ